jgi:hypothetical protein
VFFSLVAIIISFYYSNTTITTLLASRLNKAILTQVILSLAGKAMSFVIELGLLFGLIDREGYIS